jgi:type I restriction enzyme R subunit
MEAEQQARQKIDQLLSAAGWVIQDRRNFDRNCSLGVACREFLTADGKESDYMLFIDGKAAGIIEAKKAGIALSGTENQSNGYACALPPYVKHYQMPLPFVYESNGEEIYFSDARDTQTPARKIFAFHSPKSFLEHIEQPTTLRQNLRNIQPLNKMGLRDCQIEAINGLEKSLAQGHSRSLIQMATGAGKTYTACNFSYRLIKYAKAKRILFLVDRNNLGRQTLKEFQTFSPSEEGRKFTDLYIAQHLQHNKIDKDAKIVITTIQRLYSMLRGEEDYSENNEEFSSFEATIADGKVKEVAYNPDIPIDFFDFIITDECHRSIYGLWRQVLEYFDAFIIGLTATPAMHTFGFFNKNIVSEYPYERSVADQVNVGYDIYRISTEVSEKGGKIPAGYTVPVRDKKTRHMHYEAMQEDFTYKPTQLDRSVLVPNQIRTVLQKYKDELFTTLFPEREPTWVPKTLIFAKDDNHAEEITRICREVFNQGNDFCKKITYNVSGVNPEDLIKEFRATPTPRIAVTVDMIATGTDIKPLEIIIFMRDVQSEIYYEQMRGRGVRTINPTDLMQITPNAGYKNRFVLIDAVGVTESKKNASQPLDREKKLPFKKLLEQVSLGRDDDDALETLAARLSAMALSPKFTPEDDQKIQQISGKNIKQLANTLLDASDPDKLEGKTVEERAEIKDKAVRPFSSPLLRTVLEDRHTRATTLVIDDYNTDKITHFAQSDKWANSLTQGFADFIAQNKDQIEALSIIYGQSYAKRHLTYDMIRDLVDRLMLVKPPMSVQELWRAYAVLKKDKVRGVKDPAKILTNIIQLVRCALGYDEILESFDAAAQARFNLWLGRQKKMGTEFTTEQLAWLKQIKDYISANGYMQSADVQETLGARGGIIKAVNVFGNKERLDNILNDLSTTLMG